MGGDRDLICNGKVVGFKGGWGAPFATATVVLAPTASNDEQVVAGGTTATGNVLENDTDPGAAGPVTQPVFTTYRAAGTDPVQSAAPGTLVKGLYGDLVINTDGTYTYVANDTASIAPGDTKKDVFLYSVSGLQGGSDDAALIFHVSAAGTPAYAFTDLSFDVLTFTEQSGPQIVDQAGAASIATTASSFDGLTLDVGFVAMFPTERLTLRDEGAGSGKLNLSPDGGLYYDGQRIGTWSGGIGTDLRVTFNANATTAAVSAVLRNVQYEDVGEAPLGGVLFFSLEDADNRKLAEAVVDLEAVPVDDLPVAVADVGAVNAGAMIGGNALANDFDPDAPGEKPLFTVTAANAGATFQNATIVSASGVAIAGAYGTLHLRADGIYQYVALPGTLANGATAQDVFSYRVADPSGAGSTATLTVTVKGLTPIGSSSSDTLHGTLSAESIDGALGDDVIFGYGGNDTLSGGEGADRLYGGAGADRLDGGAGKDRLDGGVGADRLVGGSGDDVYVLDHPGDVVVERAGAGVDTVLTTVSYTLAKGVEVERLQAVSSLAKTFVLTGNAFAQTIAGQGGADTINGRGGGDTITTGLGRDVVVLDQKSGPATRIVDFARGADKIHLKGSVFGLDKGALEADAFLSFASGSPLARDAEDRLLYNRSKGLLYFDADGTGASEAVLVARFINLPKLSAADFLVI